MPSGAGQQESWGVLMQWHRLPGAHITADVVEQSWQACLLESTEQCGQVSTCVVVQATRNCIWQPLQAQESLIGGEVLSVALRDPLCTGESYCTAQSTEE